MRHLLAAIVLGFSCSLPALAGDGRAVEPTFLGVIVTSSLAVTLFPVTLTEDAEASSRNSSKNQDKKIVDARNDAAAYVASDGAILGVELQAALSALRPASTETTEDEMQLAKAILAYQPAN
ncbi:MULTISPECIES: DUF2388 domain-containing protein [Pseudomonas]|uniref:Uncharacterized protein (TIGR02448 family) n=1 Tax=Pseudomonas putida TaxID=303 RepID=A0A9X8ENL3_PSEPU|nr:MULTISPECIES: DUF2388 domain-containing protein [Pseudomonas]ROQ52921.1 uncharacterized protein (TIGR02448 family) [Pseudomonas putida]